MADITPRERFLKSMKGEEVDKVPVCSVTQTGTVSLMEICGAHWPEAHYNADKMATLAIAGHEIAGLEAVRCPFDGTAIAQTLGCTIMDGTADAQPGVADFPCKKTEDIQNISIPDNFLESERIAPILNSISIIRERVGEDLPVVGGMLGPAAISLALAGVRNYLMWSITKPDALKELLQIGSDVCTEYANGMFNSGADAVCMPDSEGGPDLVPPEVFETLVLPAHKRIASKKEGMMISHMCGDATAILDLIPESGFEGISIEEKVDAGYAKQVIGNRACLIGNVSPVQILLAGKPEEVKEEAKLCIEKGVDILAPGCGLAPHTPLRNLEAFVSSRDEYYQELS